MKLVCLNVWGGKLHAPLMDFFKSHSRTVDIFCLQEVFSSEEIKDFSSGAKMNLYQDISEVLPDYHGYYGRKSHGYDYEGYIGKAVDFGNAIFVKKDLEVENYEELFEAVLHAEHDWKKSAVAKAQYLTVRSADAEFTVCNFHGLWIKDTFKKDIPERIEQSKHLRAKLDLLPGPKILCGDFNLVPDGESIKILGKGMHNLILDYGITSTRSSIYSKEMKYADYVLTGSGIEVSEFKTLPEEVSDHLALFLNFEVATKAAAENSGSRQKGKQDGARN